MANALTVSRPPVGTAVSVIRGLPGIPSPPTQCSARQHACGVCAKRYESPAHRPSTRSEAGSLPYDHCTMVTSRMRRTHLAARDAEDGEWGTARSRLPSTRT